MLLHAVPCRYFGHLASVVEEATDFVPPTVNQIRLAYPQLTPGHLVASQQLQQLLLDLGIHQGTLDKVGLGVTPYTMWCVGWRRWGQVASRQRQRLCLDLGKPIGGPWDR